MSEANNYVSRWQKLRELTEQVRGKNLRIIIDALKAENVTQVVMSYYGGGDSGDYHYPIFTVKGADGTTKDLEAREGYGGSSYKFDSSGQFETDTEVTLQLVHSGIWDHEARTQGPPYIEDTTKTLISSVYTIMEQAVEVEHSGWYNNEGGEGTVTIDVDEECINVEHGDYIQQIEWDNYSIQAEDV